VEEILLLNKFFPIVDTCCSCEDIARQSYAMVRRRWFLGLFFASCIFSEPRAARFRPAFKFTRRPHHVWKYGRHPLCNGWD